ncbi:unnamed protein product [Urochloa decumbens]|uniref:Uncharacterized protein n=1 Tax=Urochloa decumbens TaxID=240449 RepID=A0ABC9B9Q5_9POAL
MQINLLDMVSKVTALRVMVQLLNGGHVLKVSLAMDTHQEVCLHLRTTTHPTVVIHRRDHQEAAWAGTKGRALHPIRVVVLTTTSRDLNHTTASHQATLLDQGITTVTGNLRLLAMVNLRTRNMRLNRTMVAMVILDTVPRLQTSTTGSHQWALSKATLNSQILMLGLHTMDLDNGHRPEVLQPQMAPTRHHHLHLMGHPPSNLLLMAKHMVQQLGLMGMLNKAIHSRVGKHQPRTATVHQQHKAILSKAHNKVAMRSTRKPNQHMVIKQLKPMPTMATRELQRIPTMEVPTHSQDMDLLRWPVRLVMLLHQQLVSLQHMAKQDTPSHLQILQVMISLQQQHQLRADILHLRRIHSLLQQRGCHHSLLLDMWVGSGQHEPSLSIFTDSKNWLDTCSNGRIFWTLLWMQWVELDLCYLEEIVTLGSCNTCITVVPSSLVKVT